MENKNIQPLLEANNLSKQYDHTTVLDQLNLKIFPGEIYCLLGQNGAGKTTTINLFLGFIAPSSGSAKICGEEIAHPNGTAGKNVAYIPEVVNLYTELNALENLEFFSKLAGLELNSNQLSELLLRAGLPVEAAEKRLSGYSKGMRQKVGIAIALAKDAKVILMDEPTSGLDPIATEEFTKICKQIAAEGRSILMATHDIFNAVSVGTRIGIMRRGKLVHQLMTVDITAEQLQRLYMETI